MKQLTCGLWLIAALFASGCSGHWFCGDRDVAVYMPPPEIILPPHPPQWTPPAWWNGTTGAMCLVHNTARIEEIVPIAYGLPGRPDPAYAAAETNSFPNTWYRVPGGCCVEPETEEMVRYCPECRKTERRWRANHKEIVVTDPDLDYVPRTNEVFHVVQPNEDVYSVSLLWNGW